MTGFSSNSLPRPDPYPARFPDIFPVFVLSPFPSMMLTPAALRDAQRKAQTMKKALVIGYMSFVSIALVAALIIGARN